MNQLPLQGLRNIDFSKIDIEPINHMTLGELVGQLEIHLFDKAFQEQFAKTLAKRIFIFRIINNGKSWEIRRTVEQFENLERDVTNNAFFYYFKDKQIAKSLATKDPSVTLNTLRAYMKMLLSNPEVPQCLLNFLEISSLDLPLKIKEGYMLKKKGGRSNQSMFKACEVMVSSPWQKRYFIITQQALLYTKEMNDTRIRECLNFDSQFEFRHGKQETGEHNKIVIQFAQRTLIIKAENLTTYIDFLYSLYYSLKTSPYKRLHRYGSFAPIRTSNCKWYVDGIDYFSDVCDAIKKAKETVYITDWWLSPELFLKRPVDVRPFAQGSENLKTRLDSVLKEVADRGIIVLVLVYNAPSVALTLDTKHTQMVLESLSQNIKVIKHPGQKIPKWWSHHEKMVLIDQKIGFMGGLDLCFGRWDTNEHLLFDQHPFENIWPQIDFSNSRIRDFVEVKNYEKTLLRENEPRMPWHDIAIQIEGDTAIDLARHFTQYWNHATMEKYGKKDKKKALMHANDIKIEEYKPTTEINLSSNNDSDIIFQGKKEQDVQIKQPVILDQIITKAEIQIEMHNNQQNDMHTSQVLQEQNINKGVDNRGTFLNFMDQLYREQKNQQPRFSEMLTVDDQEEEGDENEEYQFVADIPKKPVDNPKKQVIEKGIVQQQQRTEQSTLKAAHGPYFIPNLDTTDTYYSCITQLCRSSCCWSTGIKIKEHSIQNAYLQLIQDSKHFIYIENQFFISRTAGSIVKNLVTKALVQRIIRAHNNNEKFKVIVFIPLLPGFEGEIDQKNSAVLKVQLHWEYQTISRGGTSIMEQLKNQGIDPKEYIQFFSLRQHSMSPQPNSIPVTEIIYIHSKLMIIDDEIALIGSANINDRSLNGNRDSELAIIVQDQSRINSIMNGQNVQVAKFAHTLRIAIFMEHFGLTEDQVKDPLNNDFLTEIRARSAINSRIYREIFACYPDDLIESVAQYEEFKSKKNLAKYDELKVFIKGHAVQFPLNFLQNEELKVKVLSKEYLVPDKNFT